MTQLKTLFDWLDAIIKRQAMYGFENVHDIHLFIFGYCYGATGEEGEILHDFSSDFRDFTNEEFQEDFSKKIDWDWARLIRFNSSDGRSSIALFGKLFDQFPKQKYIDALNAIN